MKNEIENITKEVSININQSLLNTYDSKTLLNLEVMQNSKIDQKNYKLAKETRADSNKLKTEFKNAENKMKKIVSNVVKENTKEFVGAIDSLDSNIKVYEKELREQKSKEIQEEFDIEECDIQPQWLNQTYTFDKIRKDIEAIILEEELQKATEMQDDETYSVTLTFKGINYGDLGKYQVFANRNNGYISLEKEDHEIE